MSQHFELDVHWPAMSDTGLSQLVCVQVTRVRVIWLFV